MFTWEKREHDTQAGKWEDGRNRALDAARDAAEEEFLGACARCTNGDWAACRTCKHGVD